MNMLLSSNVLCTESRLLNKENSSERKFRKIYYKHTGDINLFI